MARASLVCFSLLTLPPLLPAAGSEPAAAAPTPLTPAPAVPQIPRDAWKDCAYNDRLIRCRDQQGDDWLRIVWIDGIRSSFRLRTAAADGRPGIWVDSRGGLWSRELLVQGNSLLTHLGNGNRILVPLRFPCRPPLKGEVGYCHI